MGAIVLIVGVIGIGAVIGAVVVFAVIRSRRKSGNSSVSGAHPQNMGYPPQQAMYPTAQQPYASAPSNQAYGYPAPPAQPPNPYGQQPPYQG